MAKNVLTIFEILRIWFGGEEYAERRVPEVLAELIMKHQNEQEVVAIASRWMQENLQDESVQSIAYWLAGAIKRRWAHRKHFMLAVAQAIELTCATADELRALPQVTNATDPNERAAAFAAAVDTKFKELYAAAKTRLNSTTLNPSGGPVADKTNSAAATAATASEKLREFVAPLWSGIGNAIEVTAASISEAAIMMARVGMLMGGVVILYCLWLVSTLLDRPETLPGLLIPIFKLMVGVPTVIMIVGFIIPRIGGVIQGAALAFLLLIGSTLLVVTGGAAMGSTVFLDHPAWNVLFLGLLLAVVWDRLIGTITQKLVSSPKFFMKWLPRFLNDRKIDEQEAKELAQVWRDGVFVERVTVLITSIVISAIAVLTTVTMFRFPDAITIPSMLFLWLTLILGAAYVKINIKTMRPGDYPEWLGLKKFIVAWVEILYSGSMRTTVFGVAILVIFPLLIAMTGNARATKWWAAREHVFSGAERTATVVSAAGNKTLGWAEEKVGVPTVSTTEQEKATSATTQPTVPPTAPKAKGPMMDCDKYGEVAKRKVEADRAKLRAQGWDGTGSDVYPWNCR